MPQKTICTAALIVSACLDPVQGIGACAESGTNLLRLARAHTPTEHRVRLRRAIK